MSIPTTVTMLPVFLSGCCFCGSHYNYGVDRQDPNLKHAPIYHIADSAKFEFQSTLYRHESKKWNMGVIEVTHLSDVHAFYKGYPDEAARQSSLSFDLTEESDLTLDPESVLLEHYRLDGTLIEPIRVDRHFDSCTTTTPCRGRLVVHYPSSLPDEINEKIRYTLLLEEEEQPVEYDFPLQYEYNYSFWDVLMGV
ncbi:MAG: hypothetical protein HN348_12335 [Proteobacteria bacterium]|jgi:hypothetical protein|nr:hypothetical protein [Pseudomonadota bacterium]